MQIYLRICYAVSIFLFQVLLGGVYHLNVSHTKAILLFQNVFFVFHVWLIFSSMSSLNLRDYVMVFGEVPSFGQILSIRFRPKKEILAELWSWTVAQRSV